MNMKLPVLAIAIAALAAGCLALFGKSDTSSEEARRLVAAGARLVDVRSPEEYAGGHIEGAVNIPVDTVGARLAELGPPDQPIVVYCRSGSRSGRAKETLVAAGFTAVHNLGPMSKW